MKAEIIAVGTELLLGQITNTNARYLSEELNALGISVYFHSVVGDNPNRLKAQLEIAQTRSDLVLMTGGLGPTKDDLTKEVIAQHVQRPLVYDQQAMDSLHRFFKARRIPMTENNKRQALVIEGARVFPNETGLAPGMAVQHKGVWFLLFPGPPHELEPMFQNYARPLLESLINDQHIVYSKVMRFCGIGESALETRLDDLIDQQVNPTIAPLAKEGEVTLRLTCFAKDKAEAEQKMDSLIKEIQSRVGQYLYGWDEDQLEEVLVQRLKEHRLTVAVAESCTGGLVSHLITRVSGASQVFPGGIVSYATEVKATELAIPMDILQREGVVSTEAAKLMAEGVRRKFNSDLGLSVTGVAGPERQEDKEVGLLYVGFADQNGSRVEKFFIGGYRHAIQKRAAKLALFHLIKWIEKGGVTQDGE